MVVRGPLRWAGMAACVPSEDACKVEEEAKPSADQSAQDFGLCHPARFSRPTPASFGGILHLADALLLYLSA